MSEIASQRDRAEAGREAENLRPKRWEEALEKPSVDYADIFEEDTGSEEGLTVWEIENFYPNLLDEAFHGMILCCPPCLPQPSYNRSQLVGN